MPFIVIFVIGFTAVLIAWAQLAAREYGDSGFSQAPEVVCWIIGIPLMGIVIFGGIAIKCEGINIREDIVALQEKVVLYEERAESLEGMFRVELLKYPEIERGIFDKISPKTLALYAVQYPQLQSATALLNLATKVAEVRDKVYETQAERIEKRARLRVLRQWSYWA